MKTVKKIWIIIAVCLIIAGSVICVWSLNTINFNFKNLVTEKIETNKHNIIQDFSNIKIDVNTSDINFVLSQTDECMVESTETKNIKHTILVQNDTLLISVEDNRKWYEHIGIFGGNMSITIYLPKQNYNTLNIESDTSDTNVSKGFNFSTALIETDTGDVEFLASVSGELDISTDTGDIEIGNTNAQNITIETDTGETQLNNVNCDNLNFESSTGDIYLINTIVLQKILVCTDTGDIKFKNSDADNIMVKSSTGDVTGTLLTPKIFITNTDTGDINVPNTTTGGNCQITTSTGDISLKIKK